MRKLIEKATRKLCSKLSKNIQAGISEDINFNFMADNIHLMNDDSLLTFYTTLVAYKADKDFKEYLFKAK